VLDENRKQSTQGQHDANDPNRTSATSKDISPDRPQRLSDIESRVHTAGRLIGGVGMQRRQFITLVSGAAALPLAARAQQPAKMKRIAMVHGSERVTNMVASYHRFYRAFFDQVSRLGFVEGKNLVVERYSAGGQFDRFTQLAHDIVDTHPDVIYALDAPLGLEFKAATKTIPIVTMSVDPVALGLVSNIARPGGNLTGTAIDAGLQIWGKRIEILKEAVPKLSNACMLAYPSKIWEGPVGSAIRLAAERQGIALNAITFDGKTDAADYQRIFAAFEQDRPDALFVSEDTVHLINGATIYELAAKHRLPAMYSYREAVEVGGLMSFSVDLEELGRLTGYQLGQILNGTNPGDIPYNQVTRYDLALNLKTAKSLGLEFPATLLGSANVVIE
jgi:putative ABC transport system substrate-binding protein